MTTAVGIDLGTTNTAVAAVRDGVASTLADAEGRRLVPSIVSFHPSGEVLVGHAAVERRVVDATNTIYSVKRLIGRSWTSEPVQHARSRAPFAMQQGPSGGTLISARGQDYTLPEISAFVLRQAKAVAEAALGTHVDRAVVTVPANFNDLQRAATKLACKLAGLDLLRIVNEPTAAALAYGQSTRAQERIAVYDLGGGTFDFTILDLAGGVFEVLATAGDTALGGDDVDALIADRMADQLLREHRFDARADPLAYLRLRLAAERVKCALSTADEHTVAIDDLVYGVGGRSIAFRFRMTRPELEWASVALVQRTFAVCEQALCAAGVQTSEVDRVVLVGGSTRIPMVARKVEQFFGREPIVRINPDEVVALGASMQAAALDPSRSRKSVVVAQPRIDQDSVLTAERRVSPADMATVQVPNLPLVGTAGQLFPALADESYPRTATLPYLPPLLDRPAEVLPPSSPTEGGAEADPQPEAGVDASAEVASMIAESVPPQSGWRPAQPPPPPVLIDVTPLSLAVETVGGYCDVILEANTPVPCDRTRAFSTASDGQTSVVVRVAQGESKRFDENTCLGELVLSNIAPAPRGQSQIAVTFEIDVDGILQVCARDVATGHETSVRLQLVGASAEPSEIDAMYARQSGFRAPQAPGVPREARAS